LLLLGFKRSAGSILPKTAAEKREGRQDFFFEKKKQKTFDHLRARQSQRARQGAKVFWFFFFKKELLPSQSMLKRGKNENP